MAHTALRATVTALCTVAAFLGDSGAVRAQGARPAPIQQPRDWLTEQQQEDGRWAAPRREDTTPADLRATAFALLAYLGDGSSTEAGPHRDVVRNGIRWLTEQQGADGRLGADSSLHDHAIATLALTHAVAFGASECAPTTQRLIDYLELHGNPGHPDFDMPLAAWRLLVRDAARPVPADAEPLLTIDEDRVEVLRMVLTARTDRSIDTATGLERAAELVARVALDRRAASTDATVIALRAAILDADQPLDDPATAPDPRATFFASWAIFMLGRDAWTNWSKRLAGLRNSQRRDGELRGTFDPGASDWSRDGGRVTSTALGVMTLQIYYRYTRLIR